MNEKTTQDDTVKTTAEKRNLVGKIVHDAMLSQHKASLVGDPSKAVKFHDVADEIMRVLGIQ